MAITPARSPKVLSMGALLAVSLLGCTPPSGPPRRPEPPPEGPPAAEPAAPRAASSADVGVGPRALPPDPRLPTVDVEDASGKPRQGPALALAPVREQMKECTGGKTGVVRVRIKTDPKKTSMDIEPGSNLDGRTHRCVLETLSTVDVDDVLSRGNPSDRPSGFTSVLRLEW